MDINSGVPSPPAAPSGRPPRPPRTRSQIGKANSAKGKIRERNVVSYLRVSGFPGAERTVRTGYRVAGRTSRDHGDIDGTPGIAWQIKDVAEREWWRIPGWMTDTKEQAKAAGADIGVLVIRRAGHAHPSEWWAHMYLGDVIELLDLHTIYPTGNTWFPIRFELQHLLPLLHMAGYGTPPDHDEVTA